MNSNKHKSSSWTNWFKYSISSSGYKEVDYKYLCQLLIQQRIRCAITGMKMDHQVGSLRACTINRIDPTKGTTKGNVRLICKWVGILLRKSTEQEIQGLLVSTPNVDNNQSTPNVDNNQSTPNVDNNQSTPNVDEYNKTGESTLGVDGIDPINESTLSVDDQIVSTLSVDDQIVSTPNVDENKSNQSTPNVDESVVTLGRNYI